MVKRATITITLGDSASYRHPKLGGLEEDLLGLEKKWNGENGVLQGRLSIEECIAAIFRVVKDCANAAGSEEIVGLRLSPTVELKQQAPPKEGTHKEKSKIRSFNYTQREAFKEKVENLLKFVVPNNNNNNNATTAGGSNGGPAFGPPAAAAATSGHDLGPGFVPARPDGKIGFNIYNCLGPYLDDAMPEKGTKMTIEGGDYKVVSVSKDKQTVFVEVVPPSPRAKPVKAPQQQQKRAVQRTTTPKRPSRAASGLRPSPSSTRASKTTSTHAATIMSTRRESQQDKKKIAGAMAKRRSFP